MDNIAQIKRRQILIDLIEEWNANRLDLFAIKLSEENLIYGGVMRFLFQDSGSKLATKCIRVTSTQTTKDIIETLVEKFRPDMKMLTTPIYYLYEVDSNGVERRLEPDEFPLEVQLNWTNDEKEGKFVLRNADHKPINVNKEEPSGVFVRTKRHADTDNKTPYLLELNLDGTDIKKPKQHPLHINMTEVGSVAVPSSGQHLRLIGPTILPHHAVIANIESVVTITPMNSEAECFVEGQRIFETSVLKHGKVVRFGHHHAFRFVDPRLDDTKQQKLTKTVTSLTQGSGGRLMSENGTMLSDGADGSAGFGKLDDVLPAGLEFRDEDCKDKPQTLKDAYRKKMSEFMDRAERVKINVETEKSKNEYHEHIVISQDSKGHSYESVFGRFLKPACKRVEIEDPYIRSHHQIDNFLRICELLVKNNVKEIQLTTGSHQHESQTQKDKLSQIKSGLLESGVKLYIAYSSTLHDREIRLSNNWIIKIGRGLDYFKPSNGRFCPGQHDFDLRCCLETTIDIYYKNKP